MPGKRRRFPSDNYIPRLIRETNTDCENQWCHRLWHRVYHPETEKREENIYIEDCAFTAEDDDNEFEIHARMVAQFGGDFESL
ncbi:hypothetical protein N7512_004032 [Penicillium capsulatum]|nr:hypothetical protein N7512_004032 [Penicillium capsulatum]